MVKSSFIIVRVITWLILVCFISNQWMLPEAKAAELNLPAPGAMLAPSAAFRPACLKGIRLDPHNPLRFGFFIEPGDEPISKDTKNTEYLQMVRYFLAALTTPNEDMWVNLSPYEGNKMIQPIFGQTEMGRDLLAQDYILKQLSSSMVYPEGELGKAFWSQVYLKAKAQGSSTNVEINTLNKVWIVPDMAEVIQQGQTAVIAKSRLKVLMEEDYVALNKSNKNISEAHHNPAANLLKTIVLPEIEKQVNEGAHFAKLRQMYHAMILAEWFKRSISKHLLSQVYVNKHKIEGIKQKDLKDNERIFQEYLKAYKKGVFNYIKEEKDPITMQAVPRKYFSGGGLILEISTRAWWCVRRSFFLFY